MTAILDRLRAEHVSLERLLMLLERETDVIDRGEQPDLRLLTDIFGYITHYPDLHHHPIEDVIFEALRRRDPDSAEAVDRALAEHAKLTALGEELHGDLSAFSGSTIIPRERIVHLLRDYVGLTRAHMAFEDGDLFPRARAVLEADDWQAVDRGVSHVEDPLFGRVIDERFRSLYETIMHESEAPPDTV